MAPRPMGPKSAIVQVPFAERTTVHGGTQAMPLTYNNATAAYSEAERTFDVAQDWTAHGVKKPLALLLWSGGQQGRLSCT